MAQFYTFVIPTQFQNRGTVTVDGHFDAIPYAAMSETSSNC